MRRKGAGNGAFKFGNVFLEDAQLGHQQAHDPHGHFDHRRIAREPTRRADALQTAFDKFGSAHIVTVIEVFDRGVFARLHVGQTRPLLQEVQRQRDGQVVANQFQSLRKIIAWRALELVGQELAAFHGLAAGLHQPG